jgi:hypothetical protein
VYKENALLGSREWWWKVVLKIEMLLSEEIYLAQSGRCELKLEVDVALVTARGIYSCR